MKRISRDIEEDVGDIIDDEDEDMYFCFGRIVWRMDRREYRLLSDRLDRRSMSKLGASRWCFDDDALLPCEVISPGDICKRIMKSIEVDDLRIRDLHVDSIRESTSDEEAIENFEWTLPTYESILPGRLGESEFLTLSAHERLESWLAGDGDVDIFSVVWRAILLFRGVGDNFHGCDYMRKSRIVKIYYDREYLFDKNNYIRMLL